MADYQEMKRMEYANDDQNARQEYKKIPFLILKRAWFCLSLARTHVQSHTMKQQAKHQTRI